jgi:4,5-DOPA dioxygenase extradiol
MSERMPTIFFGHGNPVNALLTNEYTKGWRAIGAAIPRPTAILSVSAHWYVPGLAVTAMSQPRTIHDFGGFPRELFQYRYPAPGDPQLAERVRALLAPLDVEMNDSWGLDHGTWAVLCHVNPKADIPVVQLSIDETKPTRFHYELGQQLRTLRNEGVLVMGSGDIVHNLHTYAWGGHAVEPYDWAVRFEATARELMVTSASSLGASRPSQAANSALWSCLHVKAFITVSVVCRLTTADRGYVSPPLTGKWYEHEAGAVRTRDRAAGVRVE